MISVSENPTEKQLVYAEDLARKLGFRYLVEAEKHYYGQSLIGIRTKDHVSNIIDNMKFDLENKK